MDTLQKIDHSALRTNQITIILLNILAFLINQPWVAAVVGVSMLLGALFARPAFGFLYRYLLKPAGALKPDVLLDNPEPHRFAQALGGMLMTIASLALFFGVPVLGWGLVWLVVGLAGLNAFAGFCVGCMCYYWLNRLRLPGFHKSPPGGAFPGMKPNTKVSHES